MIGCCGLPNGYRYTFSGVPGDRSAHRTQPWFEAADGAPVVAAEAAGEMAAMAATGPPSRVVTAVSRTRRLPSLIVRFLSFTREHRPLAAPAGSARQIRYVVPPGRPAGGRW